MITSSNLKKAVISLMITVVLLAAIMTPAYAEPSVKGHGNQKATGSVSTPTVVATPAPETLTQPANGVPSLPVRYAVVESRVNLMIGVMTSIVTLIPNASGLNENIAKLEADLDTLNTYVITNDSKGFNAYIKSTVHPDMLNASKAIKSNEKQFKDWGVTRDTVKQLKNDTKQLKEEYNVGAHVSAVARNDKSAETQAYLNKAGIKVKDDESADQDKDASVRGPGNDENTKNGKDAR